VGDSKLHDTQREGLAERGFCGAYWKETLVNIGLFDETFAIGEDYELYLRLVKSGGRILLTPRIKMMYFCRDTLMKLFGQYFRYGFWKVKVFKKHKGMTSFRALIPALFILYSSLMLLLSLVAEAFFYAFIVAVIAYLLVNILFSIKISSKQGSGYLCSLPLVFLTLHISHGLGFIAGVLDSFLLSRNRSPKVSD
jgi:GT2 family glycosyltransferase